MWISERLAEEHDTSEFDSGQPALDDWLRREALRAQRQDVERVTVWVAAGSHSVIGFYSIKPTQVAAASISRGMAGGHNIVPGWLLARLALCRDQQGSGYGAQLLRDALEACVTAARHGAGRVIVVDPIDKAAHDFYEHYGFTETKSGDRMAMKVATAKQALGLE